MEDVKICNICHIALPREAFGGTDGVRNACKNCAAGKIRKKWSSSYQEYLNVLHNQSRSKRRQTMDWLISAEFVIALWEQQSGQCALSGVQMTHHRDGSGAKEFNASIDRIDQDQGYTPGNIQLVCYRINILRHTLPIDMFYWWIKTIHQHSCD